MSADGAGLTAEIDHTAIAVQRLTQAVGGAAPDVADAAAVLVNVGDLRRLLRDRPEISTRRTDWGVRDDATGNVGTVGAYNRAATEEWLAELSEPSTLMRRERTTFRDRVTEWEPVEPANPVGEVTE